MDKKRPGVVSIDEYISMYPQAVRKILEELRTTIKAAAPEATEKISYQIPTFYLNGNLVHFAAFRDHISFFPGAIVNIEKEFGNEIAGYMTGKGTLQFPIDKPIPVELVSRITQYRAEQNRNRTKGKTGKKTQAIKDNSSQ